MIKKRVYIKIQIIVIIKNGLEIRQTSKRL